ncbi:thioredoxin family protein [Salinibacterium sp. G-O1]|uniref:TlpA family protein disulfide reductase n=1 Tax=Salinibacterium sp. G-O1 TaxID=3046208 RepID=UPI0024B8B0B7|nr:thioredoxin family protein [Salinibacterium sp. G-O1]MDJ0334796.1 thioredoxin family protein [Salinibacterium sp. G-O1]
MNPISIAASLLGLVALATVLGLVWRRGQGRITTPSDVRLIAPSSLGLESWAPGVTLLQFSSPLCSPCKTTNVVLSALAAAQDSVSHVDIDISERPELATLFNIAQTPTTFILDRDGALRARIGGAVKRDTVIAELDSILVAA